MRFGWDIAKAAANLAKHGVPFEDAADFNWEVSVDKPDRRRDYGETRVIATSTIRGRPHVLVYAVRSGSFRLISLRKANKRESISYENAKKAKDANQVNLSHPGGK